jgi:hypothetical protein
MGMTAVHGRMLALALVLGVATHALAFVTGDGKGKPEDDCLIGIDGPVPTPTNGRIIECTDCDPACDRDGVATPNGSCSFEVQLCVNNPNLAGCAPAPLKKIKAKPKTVFAPALQIPPLPADASAACGAVTNDFVVNTRKGGRRAGKKKVRLLAKSAGKPRRKDVDVFKFVCNPLPQGETCVTTTTASTTTSTTVPGALCGNDTINPGEQCDGSDLGGETCVSRGVALGLGYIGGTLDCSSTCIFDVTGCIPANGTCTETMEDPNCPDDSPRCAVSFSGGDDCVTEGKGFCYDSGANGYKVLDGQTVTITVPDIVGLEVFFAHETGATGTMTFRDSGGGTVGSPITTNGDCLMAMPPRQVVAFGTPVRTIEVTASGGPLWIDTFRINP